MSKILNILDKIFSFDLCEKLNINLKAKITFYIVIYFLLGLLFAISMIVNEMIYALLVITFLFMLLINNNAKLCLISTLVSTTHVLRYSLGQTSFYFYFMFIFLFFTSGKFLVDILLKRKRLNILFFIILIIYIIVLNPFFVMAWNKAIIFVMSITILYLVYEYRDDYDIKFIVRSFVLGLIFTSVLAILWPIFPKTTAWKYNFEGVSQIVTRFSGLYTDPNFYSISCLIALSTLIVLYFQGKIKGAEFYVYQFFIILFIIMSMSKMAYLTLVFIIISNIIICSIKIKNLKNKLLSLFLIVIISVAPCLTAWGYTKATVGRFLNNDNTNAILKYDLSYLLENYYSKYCSNINSSYPEIYPPEKGDDVDNDQTEIEDKVEKIIYPQCIQDILNSGFGRFLNKLTTERFVIWMTYISYLIQNPIQLLFGVGIGAEFIPVEFNSGVKNFESHNSFIELIYNIGLIGLFAIIVLVIFMIKKRDKSKKFNALAILPMLVLLLCVSTVNWCFSYQISIFIILTVMLAFDEVKDKNESCNIEENIKITKLYKSIEKEKVFVKNNKEINKKDKVNIKNKRKI